MCSAPEWEAARAGTLLTEHCTANPQARVSARHRGGSHRAPRVRIVLARGNGSGQSRRRHRREHHAQRCGPGLGVERLGRGLQRCGPDALEQVAYLLLVADRVGDQLRPSAAEVPQPPPRLSTASSSQLRGQPGDGHRVLSGPARGEVLSALGTFPTHWRKYMSESLCGTVAPDRQSERRIGRAAVLELTSASATVDGLARHAGWRGRRPSEDHHTNSAVLGPGTVPEPLAARRHTHRSDASCREAPARLEAVAPRGAPDRWWSGSAR